MTCEVQRVGEKELFPFSMDSTPTELPLVRLGSSCELEKDALSQDTLLPSLGNTVIT